MDEYMDNVKKQMWRSFFLNPIPMIGNVTSVEAAQTQAGREKLEELFALYDRASQGSSQSELESIDINIPTAYAKWKLGLGPGSAERFAKEEAILNMADVSVTNRNEKSAKKLERKKDAIFAPVRCEFKGCDKRGDSVKKCSKCKMVFYCGKEHQTADWPSHKLDCKHLSKSGLRIKYFTPEKQLKKYPLGCFPLPDPPKDETLSCFICGAGPDEVPLTFTRCCNAAVCDNTSEYQVFSYSRDFCHRSHCFYTVCASHFEEGHSGDWRTCQDCKVARAEEGEGSRSFSSTNGFNITPCLESDIPQGSQITIPCHGCKGRITPGFDAKRTLGGNVFCAECDP
uniref:MYND-type domain-containing protein n=1 Tax=Mucochytrium quahogii TaxID=96639 RepID=A0A7S2RFB8_9STRA|mmetsp:Transcript_4688/g.7045  ORF Transcript_4688/g.7045 Transcript_4688/m.7045 type:complete len:341 (+) Transcript_4688:1992-3014(+)|eukprot:CAMPEP_0203760860 /NCGR_PEP_ID=MMETSP0098-20131031/14067_1 /ASSEMBLY_ACC=CAM_ASM_000208 /TAXON_ID=96639 /ORGANISM=" , Strain NY0313808BC1" /LENGTH=340 /DNA_ID=CAMNT_0050654609 /DNA_START=304 /DNA_END=1326 /DNA_ORIENTATION=+